MLAKEYKLLQKQTAERTKKKKVRYPELTEEQIDIIEQALNGGLYSSLHVFI